MDGCAFEKKKTKRTRVRTMGAEGRRWTKSFRPNLRWERSGGWWRGEVKDYQELAHGSACCVLFKRKSPATGIMSVEVEGD